MPLLATRGSASARALALDGFQRARVSFVYVSNALQAFTVPVAVTEVRFEVAGGAGGGASNTPNTGGGTGGGLILGRMAVTPGNTLYLAAAQAGYGRFAFWDGGVVVANFAGGWPGGGNAGFATFAAPSAFAAGGSGGGYSGIFSANSLTQGNALVLASGGGAPSGAFYDAANPTDRTFDGANATVSAGGTRGGEGQPNNTATSGSALQGGSGDGNSYFPSGGTYPAAGAGGGYFGGGGGYSEDSSPFGAYGRGGNGSSFVHSSITNYTLTEAASPGPGYIILSW